jgi:hypothetical protein
MRPCGPVRISEEIPLLLREIPVGVPIIFMDPIFMENQITDDKLVEAGGIMVKRMRRI